MTPYRTRPGSAFDNNCVPTGGNGDPDGDLDGVPDALDNCPTVPNSDQLNRYGSAKGDACEDDSNGDGTLDVNETSICVSINGVVLIQRGGSVCYSTATTGLGANIAVSHDGGRANAVEGNNNTATAIGDSSSWAAAGGGDNNTASVTGDNSIANAVYGNNNTATATGYDSRAYAVYGDNNTATATGDGSRAVAVKGDNNTATANGSCTADANPGQVSPVSDVTVTCP